MVFLMAAKAATTAATNSGGLGDTILPSILLGLVIAFVELVFVHQDERGMGWMAHGIHAIPITVAFTFATMHVPLIMSYFPNITFLGWMEPVIIIIIGLIATAKVLSAAAIAGKVGEKKFHGMIIGLLIIIAPYAWKYVLADIISPMLPTLPF